MRVRRSNEDRSRSTRAQLLDAGRCLFAERGYAATSMAEIASRAQLSTGALYHHWRTKHELLAAVVGSIHHDLAAEIARSTPEHAAPLQRIQHAATVFLRRCADHDIARILLTDGPAVLGETWNELDQRWWQGPTEALLREADADGTARTSDPSLLATALLGSLTALGRAVAANPDPAVGQSAESVLLTIIGGLRTPTQP